MFLYNYPIDELNFLKLFIFSQIENDSSSRRISLAIHYTPSDQCSSLFNGLTERKSRQMQIS